MLISDFSSNLFRGFIVDSEFDKGSCANYSQKFGKVNTEFLALLDASEVFDVLPN